MVTVKVYSHPCQSSFIPLVSTPFFFFFSYLNIQLQPSQFNANVDESAYFRARKWLNTRYTCIYNVICNIIWVVKQREAGMNRPHRAADLMHSRECCVNPSSSPPVVITRWLWCYGLKPRRLHTVMQMWTSLVRKHGWYKLKGFRRRERDWSEIPAGDEMSQVHCNKVTLGRAWFGCNKSHSQFLTTVFKTSHRHITSYSLICVKGMGALRGKWRLLFFFM